MGFLLEHKGNMVNSLDKIDEKKEGGRLKNSKRIEGRCSKFSLYDYAKFFDNFEKRPLDSE